VTLSACAEVFLFPMPTTNTTEPENPPTAENETVAVTPAEIVAPLGDRMPPVTETAGETPPADVPPPSNPPPSSVEQRDAKGNLFNPSRHQVNADGSPRRNAKGNFILRNDYRQGKNRPGNVRPSPPSPSVTGEPTFADTPAAPGQPLADQYDAAAEVYLQAAYGPLQIAFGPDIRADTEDHFALKLAVANYLRSTGATELSPGWALSITLAAFAAKKASVPTVQQRALTLWEKIRALFGRRTEKNVTP
jgi:hypothetical protein